jgi:hypothetical protein
VTLLAELVDDGQLRPVLSQTFPLQDGRKAFESATLPHPLGKTVLIVRRPGSCAAVMRRHFRKHLTDAC